MSKVFPGTNKELFLSGPKQLNIWKLRAKELQKEEPRLRSNPEFKNVKCIIFPDDHFMTFWRVILFLLLSYTIFITPYRISFVEVDTKNWQIADLFVNALYFLDVLINSILAYYDSEMNVVTSNKKIFLNYLAGWMLIDLCSCIPIDMITETDKNYSGLVRLSRLPRLYKLVKLTKMIRLAKVGKMKNKVARYMSNLLKIDAALERLFWLIITFLILIHILACLWGFIGQIMLLETDKNWIMQGNFQDLEMFDLYICAVYWAVTTLTTVGYGDIHAWNLYERIVSCAVMIIGIFIYSTFISSLSNILTNTDTLESKLEKKRDIVNNLAKQYNITPEFHSRLIDAIEYYQRHDRTDLDSLIEDLPINLRTQLLIVIYKKILENNAFFENKQPQFVAYIAPLLKPFRVEEGDHIYKAGEVAADIYFIVKGEVVMVADYEDNTKIPFNILKEGYYFGETDFLLNEEREHSYSVKALKRTELLVLPGDDFENALRNFEEDGLSVLMLAKERYNRLKEKEEEAIEEYKNKRRIKRFQSFPVMTPISKKDLLKIIQKTQEEKDDDKMTVNEEEDFRKENEYLIPGENKDFDMLGESWKSQSSQNSLSRNKSIFNSILEERYGNSEKEDEVEKKIERLEETIMCVKETVMSLCRIHGCQIPKGMMEYSAPVSRTGSAVSYDAKLNVLQ
ncbi:unnamed protein product [Blepharisma stoltei]|uniref:Cyclic nucleotide-binding domain-containing protein n=1 Tax=Blepharisma stoltei TaxID=1481888 RepID=A0AAU9JQM3_9CILI|nr:unnamed protein product [Blepharisma stoltei]